MLSLVRGSGRLPLKGFALALGISVFFGSSVMADGDRPCGFCRGPLQTQEPGRRHSGLGRIRPLSGLVRLQSSLASRVRLRPVRVGRWRRRRISVLRRPWLSPPLAATPAIWAGDAFCLLRRPRLPSDGCSNYYSGIGGLAIEKPVVTIGEPGDLGYVGEDGDVPPDRGFGPFTGAIPYPETNFAPYTSAAATTGSSGAEGAARPRTAPLTPGRRSRPAGGFAVARPRRSDRTVRSGPPPGDRRGAGHRRPERRGYRSPRSMPGAPPTRPVFAPAT